MPLRKACKSTARSVSLEAQCTHTTMTRVYGPNYLCSSCLEPGMFGWIYQCTQDRENIIDEAIAHGDLACCDEVGLTLVDHINARRSAYPMYQDKFSFLDELSCEEMSKYRPDQIATLLRQKEKVQSLVQRQRMSHNAASLVAHDGLLDLSEPLPNPYEYRKL